MIFVFVEIFTRSLSLAPLVRASNSGHVNLFGLFGRIYFLSIIENMIFARDDIYTLALTSSI
jgi:hypothetical protein